MQHFEVPTEQIIAWRHHFHENPELSFKEFKTSQFIVDELNKMPGIDAVERPTETGVVAIIKGGKGAGKTLALRADIDALPVAEGITCATSPRSKVCLMLAGMMLMLP